MKIVIAGKKELILSVVVTLDPGTRIMRLLINARDRDAPHRLSGGWNLFNALVPEGAAPPSHRLIAVREWASMESGAEVVFLPENVEEEKLLFGNAYVQAEKDQISYLIVPREESLRTQTLARLSV
jgi:hypothetical protein